jgi:hypothetical protein
VDN